MYKLKTDIVLIKKKKGNGVKKLVWKQVKVGKC